MFLEAPIQFLSLVLQEKEISLASNLPPQSMQLPVSGKLPRPRGLLPVVSQAALIAPTRVARMYLLAEALLEPDPFPPSLYPLRAAGLPHSSRPLEALPPVVDSLREC